MSEPAPPILIVEDLDDHRELLTQALLDLLMPVMDGAKFLVDLRADADPVLARTPVVLMTADPGEVAERIDGAQADLILAKPFGLGDLRRAVVKFCGQGAAPPRWDSPDLHDLA